MDLDPSRESGTSIKYSGTRESIVKVNLFIVFLSLGHYFNVHFIYFLGFLARINN